MVIVSNLYHYTLSYKWLEKVKKYSVIPKLQVTVKEWVWSFYLKNNLALLNEPVSDFPFAQRYLCTGLLSECVRLFVRYCAKVSGTCPSCNTIREALGGGWGTRFILQHDNNYKYYSKNYLLFIMKNLPPMLWSPQTLIEPKSTEELWQVLQHAWK